MLAQLGEVCISSALCGGNPSETLAANISPTRGRRGPFGKAQACLSEEGPSFDAAEKFLHQQYHTTGNRVGQWPKQALSTEAIASLT